MKPKLLLCLALVLSGGLLGCSTVARHHGRVQPQKAAGVTKIKLKFVKVDSQETAGEDGYGKNAVDGNPNTFWDTQWTTTAPAFPTRLSSNWFRLRHQRLHLTITGRMNPTMAPSKIMNFTSTTTGRILANPYPKGRV